MKRLAFLLLPACLSVPDGPKPECATTSDCDTANGEVCDEGVCWGNPPMGPFAAVLSPPSERKNDLVSREFMLDSIAADGTIEGLQLETPITYSGQIHAVCPTDCSDKATPEATIVVTRPSADFFANGPGYRQVITVEPRTGQFSLALPASHPEIPYTITVIPQGRDDAPQQDITLAQLVPPLHTILKISEINPDNAFDLSLGTVTPTIDGVLQDRFGFGLGSYRVVALGRWDANAPLGEVSTVDYTTSDGVFHLRLSADLLPDSIVEIVAKPYGTELRPTLHMNVATGGAIPNRTLSAPDTGKMMHRTFAISGGDSGGEIKGLPGARVTVTGAIPAQPGGTITTFTAEGTTGDDGTVDLNLLDGATLASTYRVSVVPPPSASVGVIYDQLLADAGTELILPDRVALVGKVLDAGGNPLADVTVTAKPSLRFEWSLEPDPQAFVSTIPAATTVTPESGEFVVYVDPLLDSVFGTYDLVFEPAATTNAPEFTTTVDIPRDTSQSSVAMSEIYLPDAAHVRGQTTDPDGNPIEGAELRIFGLFDAAAATSLCMSVPHAPASCPIPAPLLGHGAADDAGEARLTLPR